MWRAKMTVVRLRAAFVAVSIVWAALLVVVPFAASQPHVSAMAAAVIAAIYTVGSLVCHQLPERSYRLWGAQMPVCARCAGIYLGAALAALSVRPIRALGARAIRASGNSRDSAAGLVLHRSRILLALAVTPTLVTLVYEWSTGDMLSHAIRAAAGIPIGFIVACLVVAAADNQVN